VELADWCRRHDRTIACAESLTGGRLSGRLAAMPDAASWFRGSVVAYSAEVKYDVLGVPRGPVVTAPAAAAMATGAARLLRSHLAIAVTGVGGPGKEEGQPPGTVWAAISTPVDVVTRRWKFSGCPEEVLDSTCDAALEWLRQVAMNGMVVQR
jgi:nicotinamide-nucleotide amidase